MKAAEQLIKDINSKSDKKRTATTVMDEESLSIVERWGGRKSIKETVKTLLKVADETLSEIQARKDV